MLFAPGQPPALGRAERGEYDHVLGRSLGIVARAQQVAPIRRPELPWQFHLHEPEQRRGGGHGRATTRAVAQWFAILIAYLLGAIGTTGSGIWLM
jgi:hypothetical protein